jgi:SHS2 domain-containing protein
MKKSLLKHTSFLLSLLVAGEESVRDINENAEGTVLEDLDLEGIGNAGEQEDEEEEEERQENPEGAASEENNNEGNERGEGGEEEEDDVPLIEDIIKASGYTFEEEFEDSVAGVIAYTNKIAEVKAQEKLQELIDETENSLPSVVKEFKNYVAAGNTPETFFKEAVYDLDNIVLDKDNTTQLKKLVSKDLETKGFTEDRIQKMLRLYETSDELFEEAEVALDNLKAYKQTVDLENRKKQEALEAKAQEDINNTITAIKTIVTEKGNLNGIVVPDKDKNAFLDYVTKPVNKTGNTQLELDIAAEPLERDLEFAYFRFKKLNLDNLVKQKTTTEKVKSLRARISKTKNTNTPVATRNLMGDIDFDKIK